MLYAISETLDPIFFVIIGIIVASIVQVLSLLASNKQNYFLQKNQYIRKEKVNLMNELNSIVDKKLIPINSNDPNYKIEYMSYYKYAWVKFAQLYNVYCTYYDEIKSIEEKEYKIKEFITEPEKNLKFEDIYDLSSEFFELIDCLMDIIQKDLLILNTKNERK